MTDTSIHCCPVDFDPLSANGHRVKYIMQYHNGTSYDNCGINTEDQYYAVKSVFRINYEGLSMSAK